MFRTIKSKLLLIFMMFSTSCVIIIFLGDYYNHKKTNIEIAKRFINQIYISNLFKFHLVECFYSSETRNLYFYKTGKSRILQELDSLNYSISNQINVAKESNVAKKFNLVSSLSNIEKKIVLHDSIYSEMIKCLKLRGFDDYGYIGIMKNNFNNLQLHKELDNAKIQELKDNVQAYLIRYERRDIDSIKCNSRLLKEEIVSNNKLTENEKDSCLLFLKNVTAYFDSVVVMDNKIGFKDNSALNLKLIQTEKDIINECVLLTNTADQTEKNLSDRLLYSFLGYSALLVIICLIISHHLSNKITKPISLLAEKTYLFVTSGFEDSEEFEIKASSGVEIKILIQNFNVLKTKIIELLNDFKKKLEERTNKIELQKNELIELNASKDKFFSIIAHDLKSPFSAILGLTNLLVEDIDNYKKSEVKEFVININNAAHQTFKMMNNLLDWANLQRGFVIPNFQKCNLKIITDEVICLSYEIAKCKNIILHNNIKTDIFSNCDIDMTKTVLRNLISNAIKFTNCNGFVSIFAYQKDGFIEIHIQDSGIGIPTEKIPCLFRIDKNISTNGTAGETGTGLGLLLCKELVEKQGGRIWAESELGKGSVFKFTLPIISKVVNIEKINDNEFAHKI